MVTIAEPSEYDKVSRAPSPARAKAAKG
jgi:hypothetical protein